jgi:hypothetical protein
MLAIFLFSSQRVPPQFPGTDGRNRGALSDVRPEFSALDLGDDRL